MKSKSTNRKGTSSHETVNVDQSGNDNQSTLSINTPPDGMNSEQVDAYRKVVEAQQELIRVLHQGSSE